MIPDDNILNAPDTETPSFSALPEHVAIIMDGNGRWAKRHGLPRIAGHRRGLESVRKVVKACADYGIPYLTLFAFSSENWQRPPSEVRLLMDLFANALEQQARKLHENGVRLRIVGDTSRFSSKIRMLIQRAETLTRDNTGLNLTIAANYGGHWDITQACRRISKAVLAGQMQADDVDEATVASHLTTAFSPEPDLFIRTGGEQRISNFLLWQLAYTELCFTEILWPEFGRKQFDDALQAFSTRQRRFGKTGDQVLEQPQVRNA